jgi:hypothetical protein
MYKCNIIKLSIIIVNEFLKDINRENVAFIVSLSTSGLTVFPSLYRLYIGQICWVQRQDKRDTLYYAVLAQTAENAGMQQRSCLSLPVCTHIYR